jgi:twitching motility protein PilT
MVSRNGSDLLLKVGRQPTVRLNGELTTLEMQPLKPEDLKALAEQIMTPRQVKEFAEKKEADFAIGVPGVGRFRTNIYQQRGTLAFAFRAIPYEVKTIRELELPPVLEEIAMRARGLVLVTGVTGSGKSTSLAAMINHVNVNRRVNVITIEDPIEFLHRDVMANISQREVGSDTLSFGSALKHVLRQDPDVILIGEIRDMETLDTALKAADTGHLVFATLHTTDATQTINRVISFYPPHQHQEIRSLLSTALQAVVSLRLVPKKDGVRGADQHRRRRRQHPRHREAAQHPRPHLRGLDRVRHAVVRPVADEVVPRRRRVVRERALLLEQPERVRAAGLGHRLGVRPHLLGHHGGHRAVAAPERGGPRMTAAACGGSARV